MSYDFYQDRDTHVRWQLLEEIDGVVQPKDISGASVFVSLRAFDQTLTMKLNQLLDKVEITTGEYPDTPPEKSGVDGHVGLTEEFSLLTFRLVIADSSVPDPKTISTYRETVHLEFKRPVKASPQ